MGCVGAQIGRTIVSFEAGIDNVAGGAVVNVHLLGVPVKAHVYVECVARTSAGMGECSRHTVRGE